MEPTNTAEENTAENFHWRYKHTWRKAASNTSWCLLGCAIGDLVCVFSVHGNSVAGLGGMALAIFNGLVTSIILETLILLRQMPLRMAFKTAIGMSLISMIGMELAMNLVDVAITGGA